VGVRKFVVLVVSALAACTSPRGNGLACGPGTEQINDVCLPLHPDAGREDARPDAAGRPDGGLPDARLPDARLPDAAIPDAAPDAAVPDAAVPDAGVTGDEATNYAIDPAHDNAQPNDTVTSPLLPLWSATFGGTVSYPLVVNGLVIVSADESQPNVRALSLDTGALVWGPIAFGSVVWLAYDNGALFALDGNGNLTALDAMTGAHRWSIQIAGEPFYWSPPVAAAGTVYVNGLGTGGETVAINEQTGAVRWARGTFDGSDGCVAVSGGVVYEAEACDQLSAWDALTGTQQWFHSGNCTGGGGAAPAVYGGLIWERDWAQGNVIIDHDGNAAGSFAASAIPAFHAGKVFYQNSGTVTAIDIASDTVKWSFAGDGQLCTSPVVAGGGGQVFVGSRNGNVYEIDESTGVQRSVHNVGASVTCFSEANAMALGEGHLIVPVGTKLVVY
jgi:outer membrane protein assembly factor BamB